MALYFWLYIFGTFLAYWHLAHIGIFLAFIFGTLQKYQPWLYIFAMYNTWVVSAALTNFKVLL